MTKHSSFAAALLLCLPLTSFAQKPQANPRRPQPTPAPSGQRPASTPSPQPRAQTPRPVSFDLTDYGVRIEPEPRLVVMMAALDAAGWDPTPAGQEPSLFRRTVRQDQESLDPALRQRLRDYFERYKPAAPATPAEQAAPYLSLAYLLGPAPVFEAPPRSDDLPAGVLEVLDFVPLLREFYRQSAVSERLPRYIRMHHEEGNRLRQPAAEMVKEVLTYLHTRPLLTIVERTQAPAPARADERKKGAAPRRATSLREKERRFLIVPDLLAAPGAINFRVIGDDYHAIVPPGTDPAASELRRAYIQYVLDPLVLRAGREISAKRLAVKQLLDEQRARNPNVTPDVFLAIARSLVVAADVRIEESARVRALQQVAGRRLKEAADEAARAVLGREVQAERRAVEDDAVARLAEAYERGAVLSFYFADQLRGLETSGFDLSNFFADMIGSIDPARESRRTAEAAEAVKRHREARERARQAALERSARESAAMPEERQALVRGLSEADELLRLGDYTQAESRLRALLKQYPAEPRVYYGLARTSSRSAETAFDPALQAERLSLALQLYQDAIRAAAPDTDAALISRAHVASGRILAHLERTADALKEFDAAIRIGPVEGGAHREAQAERQKLNPQP